MRVAYDHLQSHLISATGVIILQRLMFLKAGRSAGCRAPQARSLVKHLMLLPHAVVLTRLVLLPNEFTTAIFFQLRMYAMFLRFQNLDCLCLSFMSRWHSQTSCHCQGDLTIYKNFEYVL